MFARFFTYTSGGTEDWEGKSMKETHQGRGLKSFHFERVIGFIVETMQEMGVIEE